MKSRLLIIFVIILTIIVSVIITYLYFQIGICSFHVITVSDPPQIITMSDLYPSLDELSKLNNLWGCLQFLSSADYTGEPSIDYDITFEHLVFFEIVSIGGVGFSLIVFITWRKRK